MNKHQTYVSLNNRVSQSGLSGLLRDHDRYSGPQGAMSSKGVKGGP